MTYNLLQNLTDCSEILHEALPLLLYTHIPAMTAATLFGSYVMLKNRSTQAVVLLMLALTYVLWTLTDIVVWVAYPYSDIQMTAWSFFGVFTGLIFFLTHWFIHLYLNDETPSWLLGTWTLLLAPVIFLTPTSFNLVAVDIKSCAAVEYDYFSIYYYTLGAIAAVLSVMSAIRWKATVRGELPSIRNAKWIVFVSGVLFILAFVFTGALDSYLVSTGLIPDFGVEMYGVATMAVFIGMLAYATVRYSAFNLKLLAAQALVAALVMLIAAQYLFADNTAINILVSVTLALATIFGWLLVRSVRSEVQARELIQEQEHALEIANERQEGLIHFISHEVKGALGKAVNVYSMTLEGDYGALPEKMQPLFTQGLHDTREAVDMVTAILLSSNLKSGQMKFDMKPFDMREATESVVNSLLPDAQRKGLTLSMHIPAGEYKINGDREIMTKHVIRNLVDNSIRYTPTGSVTVSVARRAGVVVLSVEDTGVGISDEDKARLFTEGGRGKESVKVNVNSTGYGLFFAKQLIDAHKGTVRAESDGPGKGSRFVVELPAL